MKFFSKILATRNVSTNWWNFFNDAKGGKYHSLEKQIFPSALPFYKIWVCFLPPWSHSVVHQHMQHSCTLWVVYNFTDCLFGTFTYKRVNYKCKIYSSKFRHDWSDKKKDTLYNNWLLRCKWNFGTQLYVQLITLCPAKVLNRLKLYLIEI